MTDETPQGCLHTTLKRLEGTTLDADGRSYVCRESPVWALRDTIAEMRRAVAKPMHAWETGDVVAASTVEYWADELEAALSSEAGCGAQFRVAPLVIGVSIGPPKEPR